jgi:hypothetical protein
MLNRSNCWEHYPDYDVNTILAAGHSQETPIEIDNYNDKSIEDYVEMDTVVVCKRVPDAETPMMEELKDMTTIERRGATTTVRAKWFKEMFNAIGDSLSDLTPFDNEQYEEEVEDAD